MINISKIIDHSRESSSVRKQLNMFYGAAPLIFELAEKLRNRMTLSEEIIWNTIKINEWHLKFRRQHPISNYIADFYCHKLKLVIEIDGGYHEHPEVKYLDKIREDSIKEFGITILRFKNKEVINRIEKVIAQVGLVVKELKAICDLKNSANNGTPSGDGLNSANNGTPSGDGLNSANNGTPSGDGLNSANNGTPSGDGLNSANNGTPSGDGGLTRLHIIKIGGNIIDNEEKLSSFLKDFASIDGKKILVHGGGKLATAVAEGMGIKQTMIDGRRITDEETLKVITMVYAGFINKNIVSKLRSHECNALGITGADANLITAHKRISKEIDYGFAGDIDGVNTNFIESILHQNISLVVAPVTSDDNGQLLNTNADSIANEIAKAMSILYNVSLIYCFEKNGVLKNPDDDNSFIDKINSTDYISLKTQNIITAGMIPKLDNAFAALNAGVEHVTIGNAQNLQQLVTHQSGTAITNG